MKRRGCIPFQRLLVLQSWGSINTYRINQNIEPNLNHETPQP